VLSPHVGFEVSRVLVIGLEQHLQLKFFFQSWKAGNRIQPPPRLCRQASTAVQTLQTNWVEFSKGFTTHLCRNSNVENYDKNTPFFFSLFRRGFSLFRRGFSLFQKWLKMGKFRNI